MQPRNRKSEINSEAAHIGCVIIRYCKKQNQIIEEKKKLIKASHAASIGEITGETNHFFRVILLTVICSSRSKKKAKLGTNPTTQEL